MFDQVLDEDGRRPTAAADSIESTSSNANVKIDFRAWLNREGIVYFRVFGRLSKTEQATLAVQLANYVD